MKAICKICYHYELCKEDERCLPEYLNCNFFKNKLDVVEVVRCKDCIHYKANSCFNRQWDLESSVEIPLVREDDYCSYGERKCE